MKSSLLLCSILLIPEIQSLAQKLGEVVVEVCGWLLHANSVMQYVTDSNCRFGVNTVRMSSVDPLLRLAS